MGKSDPDRRRIAVDRTTRDTEPIAPPIAAQAIVRGVNYLIAASRPMMPAAPISHAEFTR
jgi:hypothetical protein